MNIYGRKAGQHHLIIPVLGILPILTAISSIKTGFAIGVVFCCVYLSSSLVLICCRPFFAARGQWVMLVVIIATLVSIVERLLQTWFYGLSVELGMYIPLLAMNGLLIAGLQEYVLPRKPLSAFKSATVVSFIVLSVCVLAGILRGSFALPVFQESAGLYLLVALLLAVANLAGRKFVRGQAG